MNYKIDVAEFSVAMENGSNGNILFLFSCDGREHSLRPNNQSSEHIQANFRF